MGILTTEGFKRDKDEKTPEDILKEKVEKSNIQNTQTQPDVFNEYTLDQLQAMGQGLVDDIKQVLLKFIDDNKQTSFTITAGILCDTLISVLDHVLVTGPAEVRKLACERLSKGGSVDNPITE